MKGTRNRRFENPWFRFTLTCFNILSNTFQNPINIYFRIQVYLSFVTIFLFQYLTFLKLTHRLGFIRINLPLWDFCFAHLHIETFLILLWPPDNGQYHSHIHKMPDITLHETVMYMEALHAGYQEQPKLTWLWEYIQLYGVTAFHRIDVLDCEFLQSSDIRLGLEAELSQEEHRPGTLRPTYSSSLLLHHKHFRCHQNQ